MTHYENKSSKELRAGMGEGLVVNVFDSAAKIGMGKWCVRQRCTHPLVVEFDH